MQGGTVQLKESYLLSLLPSTLYLIKRLSLPFIKENVTLSEASE